MIKSMTGFGNAEAQNENISVEVEIKTLNSKFLDLSLKLPKTLNAQEIEIRNVINQKLIRGKAAVSIKISTKNKQLALPNIDQELFTAYYEKLSDLEETNGRKFNDLMKMTLEAPEIMKFEDENLSEEDLKLINDTLNNAIDSCNDFRKSEGQKVGSILGSYVDTIAEKLENAKKIEPQRLEKIRTRLQNNIKELTQSVDYDQDRLEQELIYYSEKLDVHEEMERLAIHLKYFSDTLNSKAESHGKKLGFISQEIGREINTLGSKANDSDLQEQVIQMKEELEKIKEQSLNVL
ncbi:YicC/YloC family endoribonuclease [Marivirga arenosa]|uniref:YicC/YloC family endoribonuclease n=1 Tax=Marivirga arenosa TaxID=3059076 RepID=A0AA49GEP7_9BACT|nr:YicC/YloC family endoribonuclease [Marivirga sp. BKB1-2]WKK82253.2 YicC/YloC family endoribonuclease [Marivirga sp. BKB1-2]